MANYQELLSKAVGALSENNGAARREVYEKARKALVSQLRAISPPLPAREITQHRLELEDCIREVEHQATEAVLGGLKDVDETPIPLAAEENVAEPETKIQDKEVDAEEAAVKEAAEKEAAAKEVAGKEAEAKKAEDAAKEAAEKEAAAKATADKEAAAKEAAAKEAAAKEAAAKEVAEKEAAAKEAEVKAADAKKAEEAKKPATQEKAEGEEKATSKKGAPETKANEDAKGQSDNSALDAIIARAQKSQESVSSAQDSKSSNSVVAEKTAESADKNVASDDGDVLAEALAEAKTKESFRATTQSDKGVGAAMSRVREVDNVEPALTTPAKAASVNGPVVKSVSASDVSVAIAKDEEVQTDEAQSAVDRAIQTLDREARGEGEDLNSDANLDGAGQIGGATGLASDETCFVSGGDEEKSSNGLTIFLVLVILLLGAVGGGGYWAWKEGFIDLDSLFASGEVNPGGPEVTPDTDPTQSDTGGDPIRQVGSTGDENSGPGNTATDVENTDPTDPDVALEGANASSDEQLPQGTDSNSLTSEGTVAELSGDEDKTEERLGTDEISEPALGQEGDVDPNAVQPAGAQSLLLEASADGSSGAVPFSGTVDWSRGIDELGEPTLVGEANIPARNMKVKVLIRRNADPSLPASHLMEIDFDVSETFVGGAVAGLPGILLKNEELVQGAALVGASARVVGNSFLFALSASEQDVRTNLDLLENRKWMDLALIYASGRRAIITLEKDAGAQAMFTDVLASWNAAAGGTTVSEVVNEAVGNAADSVADAVTDGASTIVDGAVDLIGDAVSP